MHPRICRRGRTHQAIQGRRADRAQRQADGRAGRRAVIEVGDTVKTGADGSGGITFHDDSLLSAGPNSELVVERFVFDSTTHQGEFDTRLKKGTLAFVSGKIGKQSPEAMRIKTPATIMGVRGTEFIVKVNEPAAN